MSDSVILDFNPKYWSFIYSISMQGDEMLSVKGKIIYYVMITETRNLTLKKISKNLDITYNCVCRMCKELERQKILSHTKRYNKKYIMFHPVMNKNANKLIGEIVKRE